MNNIKLSTSYFILSDESNLANQYLAVSFRPATEIIDKAKQKINDSTDLNLMYIN